MTASVTFAVEGMSCEGCVADVRKALESARGVSSVEVTLTPPRAMVGYDEQASSPAELRNVIEALGFDVPA